MPRLIALAAPALLLAGCERAPPPPAANVALDAPAPARPALPPEAIGDAEAVEGGALALERMMIPELDGVAPVSGRWEATPGRARFVGAGGVGLAIACDAARREIVILHRPARAPDPGEASITLLTERGTNLFAAQRPDGDPRVAVARFTAALPFFDALAAGDGVIGVVLGTRAPIAIPADEGVSATIGACR